MNNLTDLFNLYSDSVNPPIIELLNKNKELVGALYLKTFQYEKKLSISETNNSEKYMLYVDGISIFFTYFRKIETAN